MIKVLMTGAGAPGGPGIIKSLLLDDTIDLIVCDADENATGRFLCPSFITVPKADDPGFIPAMLDIARQHKIDVIFPLVTKELFRFASAKEAFGKLNTKIIVAEEQHLNTANNKGLLYTHLQQAGISVPDFEIVQNLDALKKAVIGLGYPEIPVCIKPTLSNGSRGFRILDPKVDQYEIFFQQKPNNTYSTLESIAALLEGRPFIEMLVSEYLPGEEYTIDCIASNGSCEIVLPRKRTKMLEGISIKGTFIRSPEIIAYCEEIIRSLQLDGPIGIQVKQDRKGSFKILEINPRIQGTSVAALGVGINLPLLAVKQAMSLDLNLDPAKIQWGRKFSRYWSEVFHD